jgi:hypothetical protein
VCSSDLEHTREICASLLRMKTDEIDRLVAAGVLQPPPDDPALTGSRAEANDTTAKVHSPVGGRPAQ